MSDGELCPSGYEITSESDCIAAADNLQLEWQGSWEGHDDFPNCLFANDGRSKVYFNLSPKPSKTVHGGMLKYAAICQKPSKLLGVFFFITLSKGRQFVKQFRALTILSWVPAL